MDHIDTLIIGAGISGVETGMLDSLSSGYVLRGKDALPRQGSDGPWKVEMHYGKDKEMLLDAPIDDGHLEFGSAFVTAVDDRETAA